MSDDDYMLYSWQLGMIAEEERREKERKKKEEEEKARREEECKHLEEMERRHPHKRCTTCGFLFLIEDHSDNICPRCGAQNERERPAQQAYVSQVPEETIEDENEPDGEDPLLSVRARSLLDSLRLDLEHRSNKRNIQAYIASMEHPVTLDSIHHATGVSPDVIVGVLGELTMQCRVRRIVNPNGVDVYEIVK